MPDFRDPRSLQGLLARGQNIYNSGTFRAQSGGGPQYGRPSKRPIPQAPAGKPPEAQKPGMDMKAAIIRRLVGRGV